MGYLEAHKVTKNYAAHKALDEVSIDVPAQSIFGLLGPNGAGKTSLIRIINQITAPDTGTVILNGNPLKRSDIERIGYLPEERGLYKKMKVGEQAIYLARLKGLDPHTAKKRLKAWFEKLQIQDWWNRKVEELSKGMQQKVQFAVTVIHEPELLIFDEPFSGFDPINTELLKNEIKALRNKGATVLFSTHNMSSVEEICDHIALINKSKVVLEGAVHDIRDTYKSHTYEVLLETAQQEMEIDGLVWMGEPDYRGFRNAIFQFDHEIEANKLLKDLLAEAKIHGFREKLPSMQEIFIKAVSHE